MKIMAIDYGIRKIGLALGDTDSKIPEPLKVLKIKSQDQLVGLLLGEIKKNRPQLIVLGLSENQMAQSTRRFGKLLSEKIDIPLIYQDETLTTHDAEKLAMSSGIKRKKRKNLEDAYAAALILQNYFELKD